jgi:hypothetical protein
MGFTCLGIPCGSAAVEPLPADGNLIKEQLDEVIVKLRKRGGARDFSGEAVNRVIAHCIESDLSPAQQLSILEAMEFTKVCTVRISSCIHSCIFIGTKPCINA